jgi:hypothetical protein
MGEVVDRRSAGIHADVVGIERHEGPLFPGQGIVEAQLHGNPSGGGRASNNLVFREKTASASESLANNLAANAADGEETVHVPPLRYRKDAVKALLVADLDRIRSANPH